jgi:hypothetical protein
VWHFIKFFKKLRSKRFQKEIKKRKEKKKKTVYRLREDTPSNKI